MKVTMVGKSGSGKTTYMAALHEVLGVNRVNEFYIAPTAADFRDGISKIGQFEQLSFRFRDFGFPPGTTQSTLWSFDLLHKNKFVSSFEWIDYRGGILEEINNPNLDSDETIKAEVDELLGHISLSDSVLLFADAITLTSYNNTSERRLHSGAQVINNLFRLYSIHNPNRKLTLMIILTKADSDLISQEWKQDNYAQLIDIGLDTFDEVVSMTKYNSPNWKGGIIAIGSVGEGKLYSERSIPKDFRDPIIVKTKITGFPEPINVEHPLFYCIGSNLEEQMHLAERNASEYQRRVNVALAKSNILREFWSMVTGMPSPNDIALEFRRKYQIEMENLRSIRPFISPLYEDSQKKIRCIKI